MPRKPKPRTPPHVQRLPSGKYRIRIDLMTPTGRRTLRSPAYSPDEKRPEELSAWAVMARRDYERTGVWPGEPAPPREPTNDERRATVTFGELARDWLERIVPVNLRPSTQTDYRIILHNHVLPVFAGSPVAGIRKRQVREFLTGKLGEGLALSTVRHITNVMAGVFRLAEDDELIDHNPAQRLGRLAPAIPRGGAVAPFSQGELDKLLDTIRKHWPRHWPFAALLAHTGLRVGEAQALRWGDIDWDRRRLHVARTLSRGVMGPTKTGRVRLVDLEPAALAALREAMAAARRRVLAEGGGEELVFGPFALSAWRRSVWLPALRRAGLEPRRIHDLRHTYATLCILAGVSMVYVSHQLGHSSLKLTLDTYTHWLPKQEERYAEEEHHG